MAERRQKPAGTPGTGTSPSIGDPHAGREARDPDSFIGRKPERVAETIPGGLGRKDERASAVAMSPPWLPDSQERHRQIDWRAIERDLRATLAHEVPPALNAVLRKLGVDDGTAKRRMPDLCGALLCPRPPYRMAGDGARRRAALP